jgi:hypothetical protein
MGSVETMKIEDKKLLVKLVSALVMGDGGLYVIDGPARNAFFAMNMVADNLDYIEFCKSVLENVTGCYLGDRKVDGNRRPQKHLRSNSHPFLTTIRNRIYVGKYKSLDWHALEQLDAQMLAILYMSDGSLHVEEPNAKKGLINPSYNVTLNLKRLCYADLFLLKKALKDKLNLEWNINAQTPFLYLRLRCKDVDKFMELVAPWILPSFRYKLKDNFRTVSPQPWV